MKRKYKNIHDGNIILLYSGDLTADMQQSIINTLVAKIGAFEQDVKTRKRFVNVSVECIQNLYFHTEEVGASEEGIDEFERKSVTINVYALKKYYVVQTSNYIPNAKQSPIENSINTINSKNEMELKEMYQSILGNENFSDKGTAGLGYIEIARKSKQKLMCDFYAVSDNYSLYTFTAKIDRP